MSKGGGLAPACHFLFGTEVRSLPENKLTVRPATAADLPMLVALYHYLDKTLIDLQPDFFCEAPRDQQMMLDYINAPDADYLLAELDGTVVGFVLVAYAGWTPPFSCVLPHRYANLCDLAVSPAYRRQGVGSALVAAAKRWARDRRYEYLELDVLAQNSEAIALYEAQDFIEDTRRMRCML